jgi:Protein of unknown function (DUF3916)
MRKLSLTNKKIRGVPRRLRSLRGWSDSFNEWFPDIDDLNPKLRYCNWKIPILSSLVEGKQAKQTVQAECAQRLINACSHLIAAKPDWARSYRVTCSVYLSDMFSSEVCIYMDEDYYKGHTDDSVSDYGTVTRIQNKSLIQEWQLALPEGLDELGVLLNFHRPDDDWMLKGERWFFGEVL